MPLWRCCIIDVASFLILLRCIPATNLHKWSTCGRSARARTRVRTATRYVLPLELNARGKAGWEVELADGSKSVYKGVVIAVGYVTANSPHTQPSPLLFIYLYL